MDFTYYDVEGASKLFISNEWFICSQSKGERIEQLSADKLLEEQSRWEVDDGIHLASSDAVRITKSYNELTVLNEHLGQIISSRSDRHIVLSQTSIQERFFKEKRGLCHGERGGGGSSTRNCLLRSPGISNTVSSFSTQKGSFWHRV